ncbi:TonB-dependent receptor [Massilibacteroides sp.]|uniref:TonB-dependent receptor n=1 Tax=Massilibacteroides sp. TaxID=2034766 RepID=UPI002614AD1D|nr:TonB-dependent receptor [Massilibacteroides sp.]MDD4515313.1 TonB-dependent receptor [Massilibacteroides sp.]
MKKNTLPDNYLLKYPLQKQIFRIMRITAIILLVCVFSIHAENTHSQNRTVNFIKSNVYLNEIIEEIEKQTDYLFLYNNRVDIKQKTSISAENESVDQVLKELLRDTGIDYKVEGAHIILSQKTIGKLSENSMINQQDKHITGVVLDSSGEPIIGANVIEKGSTNGTITDIDGRFNISVQENAILTISYIGYKQQDIAIREQSNINIRLAEDTETLEEVVVIGYGVVKKKDLTGSVSQLSSGSLKDLKVSHPTQAMAGQMAGVQVQQVAGAPGQAATIRVRGSGSISASSSPLYVVDGYPLGEQNLNSINPSDIESIEVLKDASAAAIYGSRAANGVVLVTTKSGKQGKVSISLDMYYGLQNVTKRMDLLNAQEFAMISKEAFNNNYIDRVPGASASDPLSSRPSGNRYRYPAIFDDDAAMAKIGAGTDWQDEIFRTAPVQNYQLSVSGGDEKTKYMFSAGYFSQDGIVIGSDYERFSARAKIDSEFTKWLKVGINLAPTYMRSDQITQGHWASDGVINAALATSSVVPVRKEDGTWASQSEYAVAGDGLTGVPNAVASALDIQNKQTNMRLFGNLYAEISLLKNLKLKTTLGADVMELRQNYFRPSNVPKNGVSAPLPSTDRKGSAESKEVINWLNENTLSYYESFGLHEIDAIAGFTIQKNTYNQNKAEGSDFPDDIIRTINNAKVKSGSSDTNEWSLVSYLARVNYRYNNRYYLTASIRTDGSSRFGKNNRYGYFPSGSVAWRVSQEDFMKDISWLDDLKLRFSFGLTGNNSIPNYGSIGTMSVQNYVFGAGPGNVYAGAAQKSFSNADLTWEKTKQYDLGLEFSVLNNRLSFSFDAYQRNTTDLLMEVDIPTITGFSKSWRNIGKLDNKGIEIGINTVNVQTSDLTWNTNINFSTNTNKVIALGPTGDPIYGDGGAGTTHITMIGKPIGNFYGYKQIGVYMNQADWENSPRLADSHVGDVKFADIDGSGDIDADDRTIIGNNMPDFTWGMTNKVAYKNFDLSIVLQGVHGGEVLHLGKRFYTQLEGNQNQMKDVLNRWQSEGNPGDGWTPRANSLTTGQNNVVSSRWIEDASFVRINNLTLGYTLPQSFIQRCNMQYGRLYFSVQNLATITGYSGFNPETSFKEDNVTAPGTDYGMYPLARTITLGVNVTF